MAKEQKRKLQFSINFDSNIEALTKANKALEQIITNGGLISKQGNTLKGAYKSSSELLNKLTNIKQEDGKVSVTELKKMQREYDRILTMINSLRETEQAAQNQRKKQLEEAQADQKKYSDEIKESTKKVEELQKKSDTSRARIDKLDNEDSLKYVVGRRNSLTENQSNLLASSSITDLEKLKNKKKTKKTTDEEAQKIDDAKILLNLIKQEKDRREELYKTTVNLVNQEKERLRIAKENKENADNEIKVVDQEIKDSIVVNNELLAQENLIKEAKNKTSNQIDVLTKNKQREAEVNDKLNKTTKKLLTTGLAYKMLMSGIRKVVTASIRSIIDMDRALTDMSIVTGQSRDELYDMVPSLNKLGQTAGATATEMAGLTAEYMKQGRSIKDSMGLAEQTAKAAKISGISVTDSVEYMTSAINGFNLAATDAEHISDVFAKVAAATATDYKDLAISLSKVSAQANTAGLSLEFTTALLAKGIETTQEAPESIGTALKTVIARMRELTDYGTVLEDDTSINKVERALNAAGIALRNTNGEFRDLEEVFRELGPQWDSLNTMQQQAIAQAVAGTRQQSRFLAIMQDWDRTLAISNTTLDAAGASAYQFSQYSKGAEYSITNLQTAWQGFVQTFTNTDTIKGGIDLISGFLNALTGFMNAGDGIVGTITTIVMLSGAALLGFRKWHLQLELSTQELINQTMATQGIGKEEAIALLKEKKLLTIAQKITLERQKQLKFKKDENKVSEGSRKKAAEIFKLNEKDKKFTDNRTRGAQALAKFAEEQKLSEKDRLALAEAFNKAKITSAALSAGELATKITEAGLTQDQVNDELAIAAAQGVTLSGEYAILAAKIVNGKLTEEEKDDLNKITDEKVKQYLIRLAENKAQGTGNAQTDTSLKNEKKLTKEKLKGAITKIFGETHPFIAMGITAALLALLGVGAGLTIGSIATTEKKQKDVSENQDTIYENKEKKTTLTNLRDEYEEILNKDAAGVATSEDMERLKAIEEELEEIDKDLVGTGNELLGTLNRKLDSLDEDTKKLVKDNKQNVIDIATDYNAGDFWAQAGLVLAGGPLFGPIASAIWGDDIKDAVNKKQVTKALGKEENQLALRQAASYKLQEDNKDMLNNAEDTAILNQAMNNLDSLYSKIDWEELAEQSYDNLEEVLNQMEASFTQASMDIAKEDSLSGSIKSYKKNLDNITAQFKEANPQLVELYKNTYKQYDNLVQYADDIEAIEATGEVSGDQVLNLINRLSNLGYESESLSVLLDKLANSAGNAKDATKAWVDEMIERQFDTSEEGLKWWSEQTGVPIEELRKMAEENDGAEFRKFTADSIQELSKIASGNITSSNVKEHRDKLSSKYSNVLEIREAIASGSLSAENKDYLAEHFGELYADPKFQKAIADDGEQAAKMLMSALTSSVSETLTDTETALEQTQKDLKEYLKQYGGFTDYESFLEADEATLKALEIKYGEKEWKRIKAQITEMAIESQTLKDSLETMGDYGFNVEKLNAYTEGLKNIDIQLERLSKSLEKTGGNFKTLGEMANLQMSKSAMAQASYDDKLQSMFEDMNTGVKDEEKLTWNEFNKLFTVVEGQIIPNVKKINSLNDYQRQTWLQNVDALGEYTSTIYDATEAIEEYKQQAIDDAIANQEFFLEYMVSAYEKEAEELQESLDKRKEMYDKYFESLEESENTEDYEDNRQVLINRIAKLSTATDSESLKQLKEAQEELNELNKEYNSSQREVRREAVSTRLDEASENIDKKLEEILSDTQGLWEEWLRKQETMDQESQIAWLESLGAFEGMTDLMIQNFKNNDWAHNMSTLESYTASGYTFDGITKAILDGIKQAPVTNTTENGDAITNSVTATIESIVIGEGTNYTSEEIEKLVQSAFTNSWEQIVNQYGYALNRKE